MTGDMKEEKNIEVDGDGHTLSSILRVISSISSCAPSIFAAALPALIKVIDDQLGGMLT